MAVVTEYNKEGNPIIESFGSIASADDRARALILADELKEAVPKMESDLVARGLLPKNLKAKQSGNAETWWELGARLAKLIDGNELIKTSDMQLIWGAVALYASDRIKKADRGKKRDHFRNCYRLNKLPKNKVLKNQWSQWSYLLDSTSLRADKRADKWLQRNIDKIAPLKRDPFRKMVQFFNNEVCKKGKIEFEIFSDDEFHELWDQKLVEYLSTTNDNKGINNT